MSHLMMLEITTLVIALVVGHGAVQPPIFHKELDGSVTTVYKMMEGRSEDIERYRRRLTELPKSELRRKILDKHNELRATTANGLATCKCGRACGAGHNGKGYHPGATNMNELFWDISLERVAQQYSDKCLFIHNNARSSESYAYRYLSSWAQTKEAYIGENQYISSTGSQMWHNMYGNHDYGIDGGIQEWWDECINFDLVQGKSCPNSESSVHYKQYITAEARFVGCGITICPFGVQNEFLQTEAWANMNIICNYAGGQSVTGETPYNIAETETDIASECDPDRIANFNFQGLCGGPQAKDWFENPVQEYHHDGDTSVWICDDGTGRDQCHDIGIPTADPTRSSSPTQKPTNNPLTPQPTSVTAMTTSSTSMQSNNENIVTPQPTSVTPSPITSHPTRKVTAKPTKKITTAQPTQSPVVESGNECDVSDCVFTTNVQWKSAKWRYKGLASAVWNTEKEILGLEREEKWGGKWDYSWGGQYRKENANSKSDNWVLFIWDNVKVDWEQIECHKRDYLKTLMESSEFEQRMKAGILAQMGADTGEVTDVTVTIECGSTAAAAFGDMGEYLNVDSIPFSTFNLNTYSFSEWFVLLFVLFLICIGCFVCGYLMHRRRVFKSMEETEIIDTMDLHQQTPLTPIKNNNNRSNNRYLGDKTDNIHYGNPSTPNECEIGVSMHTNHGIIQYDSDMDL